MRRRAPAPALTFVLLFVATLPAQPSRATPPIRLVATIPLPGVAGRIDHLALDAAHARLFLAALGNDSVEAIDLAQQRRVGGIEGLSEPQGALFLSTREKLYVTAGGSAHVVVVNGSDLARDREIATRDDPDNIRYEPGADRIWIGAGSKQQAALQAFASDGGQVLFDIALDDHPESFQLETNGPRVFVNVPGREEVEVADREQRTVLARWKLPCVANFPMALDEAHQRLFVGCRRPPRIVGLDTRTGRVVAEVEAPADADDLFLDPASGRLYVSAGEGLVRTFARKEGDRLELVGDVATGSGARTSYFDAASKLLYVAVPRRGAAPAEIRVFDTSE